MTRLIVVMHRILGTSEQLAPLLAKALQHTDSKTIIDFCAGSGGPMLEAVRLLASQYDIKNIHLELTGLYPSLEKGVTARFRG